MKKIIAAALIAVLFVFSAVAEIVTVHGENFGYTVTEECTTNILNKIFRDNMTESEKATAIVKWIEKNIKYDYVNMLEKRSGSATFINGIWVIDVDDIIDRHLGICADQAVVTHALFSAAGFEVSIVTDSNIDCGMKSSHAWNEVVVNGTTYVIDYNEKPIVSKK